MVPITPNNKDNMVAWMSARCNGKDYGKLLVYTFPKQKLVFGPMQIEARIDQDEYISEWITLRNQMGSIVIRGDLLVIPIKDSILYVEPIYLQSTQTQLPELKQVVVSFGKRLTMKDTLPAALREVFDIKDVRAAQALADEKVPGTPPLTAASPADKSRLERGGALSSPKAGVMVEEASDLLQQAMDHYQKGQQKISKSDWAGYGAEQEALKKALDQLAEALAVKMKPTRPAKNQGGAPKQPPVP